MVCPQSFGSIKSVEVVATNGGLYVRAFVESTILMYIVMSTPIGVGFSGIAIALFDLTAPACHVALSISSIDELDKKVEHINECYRLKTECGEIYVERRELKKLLDALASSYYDYLDKLSSLK